MESSKWGTKSVEGIGKLESREMTVFLVLQVKIPQWRALSGVLRGLRGLVN